MKSEDFEVHCREDMGGRKNAQEIFFDKIVSSVRSLLIDGLSEESLGLEKMHPRDVLSIVITNITINLFINGIEASTPKTKQHELLADLLQDITKLTIQSLEIINSTDEGVKH